MVDSVNDTLYVAFETIGLYKLPRVSSLPGLVTVGNERLIEPVKSFGQAYHAIPDDDEFECGYAPQGPPSPGDLSSLRDRTRTRGASLTRTSKG